MVTPDINIPAIIVAGLIPSIVGFIYYNLIFNKAWLASLGKTNEEMEPSNPAITYGLGLLTAMLISFNLNFLIQLLHKDVNSAGELFINSNFSFGHGSLHGALTCLFMICPVIISLGVFQKASGKNILLNCIFWIICLGLMGGILDAWH